MSVLVGFHMISPSGSKVENPPPALPVTGIGGENSRHGGQIGEGAGSQSQP